MALLVSRIHGTKPRELFSRPRVSAKVSEYIIELISRNILVPLKIMQSDKFDYLLSLSFSKYIPGKHKINSVSPYTTDQKKFVTPIGFSTIDKTTKWAYLSVSATDLDETIKPKDYAILAYELVSSFLIKNFKKITKEILDKNLETLDYGFINSLPYPAPFEEQKYSLDESGYVKDWNDYVNKETDKWVYFKDEYLKHYKF
jgi:hypothetical protein